MRGFRLDRVLDFLTSMELMVGLLWAGLALFTITLLVLMRTRWGQSRPLRKCVVLSLLAHLLLVGYATTVRIVAGTIPSDEPVLRVSFVEGPERQAHGEEDPLSQEKPWEEFLHDTIPQPDSVDRNREEPPEIPEPERRSQVKPASLPVDPSLDHLTLTETEPPKPAEAVAVDGPTGRSAPAKSAEEIETPVAQRRDAVRPTLPDQPAPGRRTVPIETGPSPTRTSSGGLPSALLERFVPLPRLAAEATTPDPASSLAGLIDRQSHPASTASNSPARDEDMGYETVQDAAETGLRQHGSSSASNDGQHAAGEGDSPVPAAEDTIADIRRNPRNRRNGIQQQVPEIYSLRVAPDRSRLAQRQGATEATETAVKAALKWLAANQEANGRWDAGIHGAGRETLVSGRNRQNAGIQADTGMTGLALLAFLASGHTHREGVYRDNVRRGLEYLLRTQAGNGDLGGQATPFAKMYCHSMAAFALSEAYGMTGDDRLREPVRRAVGYTIAAQRPTSGGWRYKPGDPGDTSQCGWQLMALKSAELAGIPIPTSTRNGVIRYLQSVSSGTHGGLASYRPGEPISRPMTAEALVCWQFLGLPRAHPAGNEAGDYLVGELPGEGKSNLYYWYYATLGMYQLQGSHWQRWNAALRATLVSSQRNHGSLAGSWDPNTVWGSYGGRVYSTALAALCLEVYYRFLPLYIDAADPNGQAR